LSLFSSRRDKHRERVALEARADTDLHVDETGGPE
jgi:hypothetical protein